MDTGGGGEKVSAFIGKLSFKTTEVSLTRFLTKKGCNPLSTRVITDYESGKSKGFGYADFSCKSDMDKCLSLDGQELDGFNIHCDAAKSAGTGGGGGGSRGGRSSFGGNTSGGGFQGGKPQQQQPPGKRLKISNLSFDSSKDSLDGKFPTAVDVFIVNDRDTGRSRGFGFLEFESTAEATKMMKKWGGKSIDGRTIRMEYAGERPQSGGGGGGDRRGGFQGGRGGFGGGARRGGGRPGFSPNPARKGAIQAYEGSKKKFQDSDDSY